MLKATDQLELPSFPLMVRRFLYDQLYPDSEIPSFLLEDTAYPRFDGRIQVFYSAVATFRAPSDASGATGMRREYIRATPSWRGGVARHDCVFVNSDPEVEGMCGMEIARVLTFFSFVYNEREYQCALIHWFSLIGTGPNENTGLWIVKPDVNVDKSPHIAVIHINCIFRAAHLIPAYQTNQYVSRSLTMHDTLDTFPQFYINRFVDYHAFKIAF